MATLLLLVALELIAAAGFRSDARAGQPANSGSAPPKVVTVVIRDFKFEPATVTVHVGDTVEWKNDGIVPHTATADGGAQKPADGNGVSLITDPFGGNHWEKSYKACPL